MELSKCTNLLVQGTELSAWLLRNKLSFFVLSMHVDEIFFLYCRYVSAQRYSEALDLLQSGACNQLKHGQVVLSWFCFTHQYLSYL